MIPLDPWLPFCSNKSFQCTTMMREQINCLIRHYGLLTHFDFLQKDALTLCCAHCWRILNLDTQRCGTLLHCHWLLQCVATHHFGIIYSVGAQHRCESPSVQPEKGWLSCAAWREHNCLFICLQGLIPSLYP